MTKTTTEAETLVRQFAGIYRTPNVLRALTLCETGVLGWAEVAELFATSYGKAAR